MYFRETLFIIMITYIKTSLFLRMNYDMKLIYMNLNSRFQLKDYKFSIDL